MSQEQKYQNNEEKTKYTAKIARRDKKERGKTNQNEKELDEPRKNETRQ